MVFTPDRPPEFDDRRRDLAPSQNPPTTGLTQWPTRVLCVNEQWASFLIGIVERLAHFDVWVGDFDTRANAIDRVEEMLIQLSTEADCMAPRLRQNQFDECILEASYDNGLTWAEVFDFSKCAPVAPSSSFQFDLELRFETQIDLFTTGGLNSLAPELEYEGNGNDADRDDALCYSLHRFVDFICEAEIARRQGQISFFQGLVGAAGGLATGLASIFSFGTASIIAFGVITAISEAGLGIIGAAAFTALQNNAARTEVACCMYDNMKGSDPTKAALQAAPDSCTPALTGDADTIRDVVNEIADIDAGYVAFIQGMGESFTMARLEVLPGCECDTWSQTWLDGSGGGSDWTILPYDNPGSNECEATYNGGADRFDGCNAGSGFSHAVLVDIDFPKTVITKVKFTGSGHETRSSVSHNHLIHGDGSLLTSEDFDIDWTDDETEWTGQKTLENIRLKCAAALDGGAGTPDSRITSITVEGLGTNPFV